MWFSIDEKAGPQCQRRTGLTAGVAFASDRGTETVLVVEDDQPLRALVAELLKGAGDTVLEAANGKEAIEIAARNSDTIDLVLTDVIMPEMSGGDLATHLRRIRADAAILFMSGYAGDLIVRAGVPQPERLA